MTTNLADRAWTGGMSKLLSSHRKAGPLSWLYLSNAVIAALTLPAHRQRMRNQSLGLKIPMATLGLPCSSGGFSTTTDCILGWRAGSDGGGAAASTGVTWLQTAHLTL